MSGNLLAHDNPNVILAQVTVPTPCIPCNIAIGVGIAIGIYNNTHNGDDKSKKQQQQNQDPANNNNGDNNKGTPPPGSQVPGTDKQFGQKFGQHMDDSLPGYRTPQEYRDLANKIYTDPNAQRTVLQNGETQIRSGGNLLRLDPQGNFRSLYPDGGAP